MEEKKIRLRDLLRRINEDEAIKQRVHGRKLHSIRKRT